MRRGLAFDSYLDECRWKQRVVCIRGVCGLLVAVSFGRLVASCKINVSCFLSEAYVLMELQTRKQSNEAVLRPTSEKS